MQVEYRQRTTRIGRAAQGRAEQGEEGLRKARQPKARMNREALRRAGQLKAWFSSAGQNGHGKA